MNVYHALCIFVVAAYWFQPVDAATARNSAAHKVLFEDGHIRFVEYTLYPGENAVAAVPYPSIQMADAAWPRLQESSPAGATTSAPETRSATVFPPDDRPYPNCRVESPRAARIVTITGDFPQHYYRLEYKRIDGKEYGPNWKRWYADVFAPPANAVPDPGTKLHPAKTPLSKEWPFDPGYSATVAAPANHKVRFEDDHVQLVEVVIREGETENMHGHPYSSVFGVDVYPAGMIASNRTLLPNTPPPWGKFTSPLEAGQFPICYAAKPESPHQVTHEKGPPAHFYRVHFTRVDGEDVRTNWRTLYPRASPATD